MPLKRYLALTLLAATVFLYPVSLAKRWLHRRAILKELTSPKSVPAQALPNLPVIPEPSPAKPAVESKVSKPKAKTQAILVLPKHYDFVLNGEINDDSAGKFIMDLKAAALDHHSVTIRIDSPGGSVMSMFAMEQAMEDARKDGARLTCVVDTLAASAAFYVLQDCDIRVTVDRGVLLAHGVQSATKGNIKQMENEIALVKILESSATYNAARRMGMTHEAFLAWIYGRDVWMGSEEALRMKAVDYVISAMDSPAAPQ